MCSLLQYERSGGVLSEAQHYAAYDDVQTGGGAEDGGVDECPQGEGTNGRGV